MGAGSVVKITSLPDLGANSSVKITSLPDLGANSSVKITSLPDLGAGSAVKILSLPAFAVGSSVTVSNLASVPLTVSGTTIAITSLPALGFGGLVSISNLAITISNLATTPLTISGTTIAITSLPDIGLGSSVKVSSLPAFAVNSKVQLDAHTGYWNFTSTYTAAQTNVVVKTLPGSTTAYYITDIIFSNAQTHGSFVLLQSKSNSATFNVVLDSLYFRDYGGVVMNLQTPLICDTNSAIVFTSRTATNHSITMMGYTV